MKIKTILLTILIGMTGLMLIVTAEAQRPGNVLVLTAEGPVTPFMLRHIERGIETAEAQKATALVIQLDTPGGMVNTMLEITQAIINANVPVVVYVAPSGALAASAGTFITLSGHIAAMAPQTSIGAASPIDQAGNDLNETARSKTENILLAAIDGLTEHRGEEAAAWAKATVTEAKAANANEALELGVIDLIADDMDDLLAQLDGVEVEIAGETVTLNTAKATVIPFEMTAIERFLSFLLQPEIAFILMTIGPLAIIYELATPGGFISGIIGVICLILGLYALGQLPVNFAGLGLMVLAFVLFVAEAFTPTHGALTLAGIISLILGGLILFDTSEFDYRISVTPVIAVSVSLGGIFFFLMGSAIATLRRRPVSGVESLIGATGVAKTAIAPAGTVFVDGSRWQATAEEEIEAGERVEVVAMDGFRLTVRKTEDK